MSEPHEVDVAYVPVCFACWQDVHQDDHDNWVHTTPLTPVDRGES